MEIVHENKSYWKQYNYPYIRVVEIPEIELQELISRLSRTDIIEWLMWNDRNGIYSDEASMSEFGAVMTIEESIEIMLRQAEENRITRHLKAL